MPKVTLLDEFKQANLSTPPERKAELAQLVMQMTIVADALAKKGVGDIHVMNSMGTLSWTHVESPANQKPSESSG